MGQFWEWDGGNNNKNKTKKTQYSKSTDAALSLADGCRLLAHRLVANQIERVLLCLLSLVVHRSDNGRSNNGSDRQTLSVDTSVNKLLGSLEIGVAEGEGKRTSHREGPNAACKEKERYVKATRSELDTPDNHALINRKSSHET